MPSSKIYTIRRCYFFFLVKTGPLHRQVLYVILKEILLGKWCVYERKAYKSSILVAFSYLDKDSPGSHRSRSLSLAAEDLKSAASQFRRLHSKQLQHTFQVLFLILSLSLLKVNYNLFFVMSSGFTQCNGEHGERLLYKQRGGDTVEIDKIITGRKRPSTRRARTGKRDTAAAGSSSWLSLGAASRFASNVLRNVRHNLADPPPPRHTLASLPQKPMEPLLHRRSYK
ncbi:LOW QUALITY PROTEIN: hypothetical protein HID58_092602 [Brassica napus]|uniref:Uncharacterized protein n=1 Tax=Brassica napus TaxID=3708 RepID=A0ABQ7XFW5_BRANA|nr:LOW QUALITY PROTEIN: hypothetical protein HID58_092602 [Brassica napus]